MWVMQNIFVDTYFLMPLYKYMSAFKIFHLQI